MNLHIPGGYKGLLLVPFLFASLNLFSQITIKGKVTDSKNNPLAGASVTVKNTTTGTTTGTDGSFTLPNLPIPATLVVSFSGYLNKNIPIENGTTALTIILEDDVRLLSQIVVSASRKPEKITEAPASISVVNSKTLQQDAVVNPTMSLRYLPGINVVDNGNNYPVITLRGAGSPFAQEAYVLIDNRNIFTPGFREVALNRTPLDALDLERVEVVRGAASALYGAGVETGVVNYITKDPFQYRGTSVSSYVGTMNNFGISLRQAGATKNGKLGYKLNAYYRTQDGFEYDSSNADDKVMLSKFVGTTGADGKKYAVNGETNQLTDIEIPSYGSKSYSFSGYVEYRFNPSTNIGISLGRSNAAALQARTSSIDYADFYNDHASIKVKAGGLFGQFSYLYANNDHGIGNFLNGRTRFLQGRSYTAQLQYAFRKMPSFLDLTIGGDYQKVKLESHGTEYGANEDHDDITTAGAYAQAKFTVTDKFNIISALRYDYFKEAKTGFIAPRIGLVYKATPNHTFRISYNKAYGTFEGGQLYNQANIGGPDDYFVKIWGITNDLNWNTSSVKLFQRFGSGRINSTTDLKLADAIALGAGASKLSANVISYLNTLGISNSSPIVLKVNNAGNAITADQVYKKPVWNGDPKAVKPSTTNMFEIGYTGSFNNTVTVTVDVWLMKRYNFFSSPQIVTPIASAPNMTTDLKTAITTKASADTLAKYGVTAEQVANAIGNQFTTRFGLMDIKDLENDKKPSAINTFVQGADVQYWGIDLGVNMAIIKNLQGFANYSYLNKNQFNASLSGNENTGLIYYLMQPQHRVKLGLNYGGSKGLTANAGMVYNSDYDSPLGNATVQKFIPAYTVFDAGIGYILKQGVQLNLTATNVLNHKYRALPQWPQTGRIIIFKMTYNFFKKKSNS